MKMMYSGLQAELYRPTSRVPVIAPSSRMSAFMNTRLSRLATPRLNTLDGRSSLAAFARASGEAAFAGLSPPQPP